MWTKNKKLILSFSVIFSISMGGVLFYLFDSNIPINSTIHNPPSNSPYHTASYPYCLEDDFIMSGIGLKIRYNESLSFINNNQGGMTGYILYFDSNFIFQSNSRYLREIHHLSITSLIEKTVYIFENDTWNQQSVEDEWKSPEQFNMFTTMDHNSPSNYVYDDLVIDQVNVETNHQWLDIDKFIIGPFKQITGYNLVSIPIVNTYAKNAYFGIEEIYNNTKTVLKIKKFIIRDFITWELYQCRLFGWEQITSKIYYLGNYMLEAINGIEKSIGIEFKPFNI
ncbi:MAG: hypothetical protein ACFFCV_09860 [Promethearchaeota archaeon]